MLTRPLRAVLREPLVHFLAAGLLLFGLHAWITRDGATEERAKSAVSVSAADIEWLRTGFTRQWHRPPTEAELQSLAADVLREKLLAREAQSLGLAEDDTVVRRRLAQKMLFVVEDTARLAEPSDEELRRFHAANSGLFVSRSRIWFEHVYFGPERRRDPVSDARAALPGLARGALDPARSGDRLMVDEVFAAADETVVANALGEAFAREIFALPIAQWQGPVASDYGQHLVRVNRVEAGRTREFAEVREQVAERWREHQQREAMNRYLTGLSSKYDIAVDASVAPLLGSAVPRSLRRAGGGETR